ncbi:MAG: hypothetical protein QOJ14_187 [Thermoleophilaceae bacterium]|nr:hypothetical protein [Thermoleophilaceae bacterium]
MDGSRKSRSRSTSAAAEPLVCPHCARGYGLDERFCAHCGMPLVYAGMPPVEEPLNSAHARARKIRPELTRGELVRVAWSRNQAEAELIQNLLLEEGVPSIARRSPGFDVPDFLAAGPRDILVPESGAGIARETLQGAQIDPPAPGDGGGPTRRQAARILAGIVAGAGAAALIAWALAHAAT